MKKVVLIGCGAVGAGYDLGPGNRVLRRGRDALSHAGALCARDDLELIASVDPDLARARTVATAFGIADVFASLEDLSAAKLKPDIAVIASPTPWHSAGVDAAIDLGCRAIVCEKPLVESATQGANLIAKAQKAGVLLAVNYQRLWDEGLIALAQRARSGEFGAVQGGQASYVKGVTHNGPHLVTLVQEFCGPVRLDHVDRAGRKDKVRDADFILALLDRSEARIQVMALDHRCYNIFEATLYFERAVLHFEDGARRVRVRKPMAHPLYPSFICPEDEEQLDMTRSGSISAVYDEVLRCLDSGAPLRRSAEWCLAAETICQAVRDFHE